MARIEGRLKKIEDKIKPKEEVIIVVHKDGDEDIPDDWTPDIVVGASPEWLERQKKLLQVKQ